MRQCPITPGGNYYSDNHLYCRMISSDGGICISWLIRRARCAEHNTIRERRLDRQSLPPYRPVEKLGQVPITTLKTKNFEKQTSRPPGALGILRLDEFGPQKCTMYIYTFLPSQDTSVYSFLHCCAAKRLVASSCVALLQHCYCFCGYHCIHLWRRQISHWPFDTQRVNTIEVP